MAQKKEVGESISAESESTCEMECPKGHGSPCGKPFGHDSGPNATSHFCKVCDDTY